MNKPEIYMLSNVNLEMLPTLKMAGNIESTYNWIHDGFQTLIPQILSDQPRFAEKQNAIIWLHFDADYQEQVTKPEEEPLIPNNQLLIVLNRLNYWLNQFPETQFILSTFIPKKHSTSIHNLTNEYSNLSLLNFQNLVQSFTQEETQDERLWEIANIPYSLDFQRHLKSELEILAWKQQNKPKKVLLLDFDGTLWPGTLDELNTRQYPIKSDSQNYQAYIDFQNEILQLKNRGILLVLISKNEESLLKAYFNNNDWMPLKWDDFILQSVNWTEKFINIQEVANNLSLAVDSMLFIDDDARERHAALNALPSLHVVEFPQDRNILNHWLKHYISPKYFARESITPEDKNRSHTYHSRIKRGKEIDSHATYEGFITSLEVQLTLNTPTTEQHSSRILQLSERTNQFNLNGKTLSHEDISEHQKDPSSLHFIAQYQDRFGDEGIIGYIRLRITNETTLCLTHYYLSCRILEKRVEFALLYTALLRITQSNPAIRGLNIEFRDTGRNQRLQDFLEQSHLQLEDNILTESLKTLKTHCLYECIDDSSG